MNAIPPISSLTSSNAITQGPVPHGMNVPAETPGFSLFLHEIASQTTEMDNQAAQAVTGVLRGDGTDVHQAMIATQKADIAFEMALQVRNRAVAAYQQMMQMQF